jgi:hypothetical protein
MRKALSTVMAVLLVLLAAAQERNFWSPVAEARINKDLFANRFRPAAYKLFQLQEADLATALRAAPSERTVAAPASNFVLAVPDEDGLMKHYRVVEAPVMHPDLAAKYPGITSYAGQGIEDPTATIRFDLSPRGFHAMVLSTSKKTIYIDPVDRAEKYYVVFSRKDIGNYQSSFQCLTDAIPSPETMQPAAGDALKNADDARLRTYRLALASTGEYSTYFLNGTETSDAQRKSKVLAAMNTAMTRTNGIYERDFGIRMVLVANNDAIIYLTASTDPWTSEYNTKTQQTIDAVIGNANYDIGHLVHRTSNNGNAGCIGCVCKTGQKGSAFTSHTTPEGDPFVVDYLTHEMGHQFGGNHTFAHSYEGTIAQCEPGSGSTIMGYAGITGSTTDVQPHSDDYFHARSIEQITNYIKSATGGGACAVVTLTGNNTPTSNAGADYVIPRSTPFTLTGSGTDADATDVLTYIWEQIDARTSSSPTTPSATATAGPVFRSFTSTTSTSRTFPGLSSILNGTNTNKWEVLPSVARTLNFRFTVRDNRAGGGNNRSDEMVVTVNGTAGPFAVSAPNTAVSWAVGTTQAVTWSVNSTNVAPVNCANVKISLSTDGGNTFPIVLAANTPNDGSENIVVPNNPGSSCRVKIEAVGNIFFDISNVNFTIGGTPPACANPTGLSASSITSSSATVSWTAVSGANNYSVDYKAASSATWISAASATTATSVNLTGLSAATTYDWRVRANCSSSTSAYTTAQFTTNPISGGCTANFEPNESLAAAATVATNTNHSGAISTSTDSDWFKFTISATSNLNITLTTLPADYDIILYNSAGTEIRRSENGGTTSETITNSNTVAGTYYLRVFGWNGANSTSCYTLNIGATTVTGTCPGTYDVSTNGTLSGAATIPFNTDIKGLISPSGDLDYYKFVITTGGTITVTLGTLPGDYDLRLYNSAGTQLASSVLGSTSSESINYNAAAGTYYVRVEGYNGANSSTVCYTLKVALGTATRDNDLIVSSERSAKVQVFPNPTPGHLNINIPGNDGNSEIRITDIYGRTIMQQRSNLVNTRMNIASLAAGVYMVKVTRNGQEVLSTKIVKE